MSFMEKQIYAEGTMLKEVQFQVSFQKTGEITLQGLLKEGEHKVISLLFTTD